ncbi:predicted protein [Histoplasma mississippiense (nom. inval.)]|uniref:predicted protein n=1 Tax=Ajellomyces capsulatus (strain NAm1 / WU24) TaxID=2059318 RepID=UPI000157B5BE|nr:predicted protein [Histoplasma mississippiense (nom. inval.)]EDN02625.1 predicted protein [Histoplasma mississippiense (nom. inval.)]
MNITHFSGILTLAAHGIAAGPTKILYHHYVGILIVETQGGSLWASHTVVSYCKTREYRFVDGMVDVNHEFPRRAYCAFEKYPVSDYHFRYFVSGSQHQNSGWGGEGTGSVMPRLQNGDPLVDNPSHVEWGLFWEKNCDQIDPGLSQGGLDYDRLAAWGGGAAAVVMARCSDFVSVWVAGQGIVVVSYLSGHLENLPGPLTDA